MGKQINYYMEYDAFLLIAKKALDLGCEILKNSSDDGKVIVKKSTDIVTEDCYSYYFHVPEAGNYKILKNDMEEKIDDGYNASGATLIEADYSRILTEKNRITRARLFCISGYYNDDDCLIKRPDCVTKIFNSLVRYIKKTAPYTEFEHYVLNPMYYGKKFMTKEYITEKCLNRVIENDYILG